MLCRVFSSNVQLFLKNFSEIFPVKLLFTILFRSVSNFMMFCLELQQLFIEAIQSGTMENFYRLISYFQTQSEPAYCGLASLSMVLNALAIDPGRKWKGEIFNT